MKGIEGSTLGRYELRRRVARGGMSEVYLGYDRRVRRRVAVKVLYGSDEPFVRRFEREALAVGTLTHDHILPLYDFGEQRPWYYLVMPFVEGGTLRDYLVQREYLTLEEAGSFLEQIASALQYAHDHGVVHRDVKPSNILLRPDGYAYLGDFGLAKAKMEAESLTHSGTMIGTPEYMAPEQSNGICDYRSDIYSLGIILYQMLTGHVPFTADSPVAVSLKHIQTPPPSPREFNSEIPEAIEEIILKTLAKHPDERYQHAREVAIAYRRALLIERMQNEITTTLPAPSEIEEMQEFEAGRQPTTGLLSLDDEELLTPTTTPQLYPLSTELPSLSLPVENPPGLYPRPLHLLIAFVLFLVILLSLLPVFILKSRTSTVPTPHITPTPTPQYQATQTAQAEVRLQATLAAQARVQAAVGITSEMGPLLYASPLTAPDGWWIDDGRQCYFTPQGYHVATALTHAAVWCYANQHSFSNIAIGVQARLLYGDIYGILFRLTPATKAFYALEVNSLGDYRIVRVLGNNPANWLTLIDWSHTNAIISGIGNTNTFLVIATENRFRIYINKQLIISTIVDSAYSSGMIGFLVGSDHPGGAQAVFSNLLIFQK